MLRHRSSRVLLGALCAHRGSGSMPLPGYGNAPVEASADKGVTWLKTQQLAVDGGFEVPVRRASRPPTPCSRSPSAAQTALRLEPDRRSQRRARDGQERSHPAPRARQLRRRPGRIDAGQAAKLITLVSVPLGLSSTAFDPDGDGAKNLVATVNAGLLPNGSYGLFNGTLFAVLAKRSVSSPVGDLDRREHQERPTGERGLELQRPPRRSRHRHRHDRGSRSRPSSRPGSRRPTPT